MVKVLILVLLNIRALRRPNFFLLKNLTFIKIYSIIYILNEGKEPIQNIKDAGKEPQKEVDTYEILQ